MGETDIFLILMGLLSLTGLFWFQFILFRIPEHFYTLPPRSDRAFQLAIAFYNEEENLRELLPLLARQDGEISISLVDDGSVDGSAELVRSYDRLTLLQNPGKTGKKAALRYAIQQGKSDLVLCTDADCRPASDSWAVRMIQGLEKAEIVLGYSPYRKQSGFLNAFCRWENCQIALQYLSAAGRGESYMGVGRNLAYRREIFRKYYPEDELLSGDDDLLVSAAAADGRSVTALLHETLWCWTEAPTTWRTLINQKRRHVTTAPQYSRKQRWKLILYPLVTGLFYLSVVGMILCALYSYAFSFLIIKWVLTVAQLFKNRKLISHKDLYIWGLLMEPLMIVYYTFIAVISVVAPFGKWK